MMVGMSREVLVTVLQMVLSLLQVGAYAMLVYWGVGLMRSLPLKQYVAKIRFYHYLLPALVLGSLAFPPVKFILDLIFSFPLSFTQGWAPLVLKSAEGVAFLGLIVYLSLRYGNGTRK